MSKSYIFWLYVTVTEIFDDRKAPIGDTLCCGLFWLRFLISIYVKGCACGDGSLWLAEKYNV